VIHRPWDDTNAYHDLFYTTNLAEPINWHFVQRCVATNVSVPDLGGAQGFFRLDQTNGDLTVSTNVSAQDMAQLLVPAWVDVYNATNAGSGVVARGTFTGGHGCGLPLEAGVILSSGNIGLAVGSNDISYATWETIAPSDTDLDGLVGGGATWDAAVLEFDIVSTNSFVLQFQYIFASEEYPEFINNKNDPMAIFVSTNYDGTNWIITTNNNIAWVPGTINQPVTVNTVNGGYTNINGNSVLPTNPQYYVDNKDPEPDYSAIPPYSVNTPVFNIQYDGTTVLLTAQIKIAIEDYDDAYYDSAVFIKAWEPGSCCQCQ
jgi:hypothetical protein